MIKIIKNNELLTEPLSHQNGLFKELILKNGEIPGLLQFAKANFKSSDEIREHSHESMYEIYYIISGSLKVFCDDTEMIASTGDSIVIPPLHKHSFQFIEKTEIVYFNIPQI